MDYFLYYLITAFLPILISAVFLRQRRRATGKKPPPSPKSLPIIGNLHQIGKLPYRSLHHLSTLHGPLMLLHFGRVPVLVASSAAAAEEILKNQDLTFANRPKSSITYRLTYGFTDIAFSPYGEYWRRVRSVCVLHLLSNKSVQSFQRVREQETSIMIEKIQRQSLSVVNLTDIIVSTTNDVISRVCLGRKFGEDEDGEKFRRISGEFLELIGFVNVWEYIPWMGWISRVSGLDRKVEKVGKLFDEFLQDVIEEHRDWKKREKVFDDENRKDFVDILLELQSEGDNATLMADNTIKAIVMDMFSAGTDTTFTALEWTMFELLRNPRVMTKLQSEINHQVQGRKEITENDLDTIPYLRAVVKESLRFHPPGPMLIPHEATQDTKLMDYDIDAGTQVIVNIVTILRDPLSWENPNEFYPERFLNTSIDFRGSHFEYIPFGAGRRGCPGITFALSVFELALAKLVHNFDFTLPNGERVEDLDLSESPGLTVRRRLPLIVVATSRV